MKDRKSHKQTRTGSAKAKHAGALDSRVLERSDKVLWTIAPPGIVLHNFAQRKFIQLDKAGYAAWGYLDGARTVGAAIDRCAPRRRPELRRRVRRIVQTLIENGFLVEKGNA